MLRKRYAMALCAATAFGGFVAGCGGGGGGGGGFVAAAVTSTTPATTATTTAAQPSVPVTSATTTALPATRSNNGAVLLARHGEGFLELHHGARKVVHTKGTSYERGVQYGFLVGDMIEGVLRVLPQYAAAQGGNLAAYAQALITPAGSLIFRPYFDQDALENIRGILAGLRLRNPQTFVQEQDLIFMNCLIDLGAVVDLSVFRCSSLSVWGPLTQGGKAFQTRNVDLMVGSGLEEFALIAIEKPTGGVPYINPGFAGMIGCESGLNAHGIGVGQVWAFSRDKGFGRPWILSTRELMATGDDCEDGFRIFQNDRRTYGSNFVFCDRGDTRGGQPKAIAIEYTQSHLVKFEPNDPREDLALWNGQPYAQKMPFTCLRGDVTLDPLLRSLQTASNGPGGDPRGASAYRNRYQGQLDGIKRYANAGQLIGAQEVIQIAKDCAMRRNSLQSSVYDNSDLEAYVAYARLAPAGPIDAWQEPYHHFSLDYYTPSAKVVPDQATLARGRTVRVAIPFETLGRGRGLDVELSLEVGGVTAALGAGARGTLYLQEKGRATLILQAEVPANLAQVGVGKLVADVYEAGTKELVEVATTPFTVTP